MDIYRLNQDLQFLNNVGVTLNIDEKLKIGLGIQKLTETQKFDQFLFWGKIEGISKDYFICLGLNFRNKYEFPEKTFFWSSNDCNFALLPEINEDYAQEVDAIRNLFTGQHEKILKQVTDPENPEGAGGGGEGEEGEQQPQESDDEDNDKKIPPKNFTELDRLAFTVRAIENDCALTPVGAFRLTPTHQLRYNDQYQGLSLERVGCLSNYQHFRAPQSEEKKKLIEMDEALFEEKFLDQLTDDLPIGCWSIQTDASKTNSSVRSLLWPGFVGYHRANSRIFGYGYIGNGVQNSDLPFLL